MEKKDAMESPARGEYAQMRMKLQKRPRPELAFKASLGSSLNATGPGWYAHLVLEL